MEFYTGKDYPHLCSKCQQTIDDCVALVHIGADTDDNEAPIMFAYDHKLMCGGHECECDCSIGFPLLDNHYDLLCRVHGGTEQEQQAFNEQECKELGHWFPAWTTRLERDGLCLMCNKVYGQYVPVMAIERN
jgi:hypothetical protein